MSDVIENLTAPAQFIPFELHPNTLRTIIQEQSGTWQKAIAELVMNSVDAGATRIDINYECDEKYTRLLKLNVSDDGHGFHNEDQLNFFKMFGAPHQQNDAFYGKYRIGRGQCLAFGKVTWRSHNYEMSVDLGDPTEKETPLEKIGYNFKHYKEVHQGCSVTVEFFNPPRTWKIDKLSQEKRTRHIFDGLIELIKFVPIPIFINGICVTYDYSKIKWTHEDENAYYLIQTMTDTKFKDLKDELNEVSIYNRGVLATTFPATWKGCCGVAISKKQIKLNMARNSIVDHDHYWYYIQNMIDQLSSSAFVSTVNEPKTDAERAVIINQIYLDDTFCVVNTVSQVAHFLQLPLFKTQNGTLVSVVELLKKSKLYTVCPDPVGQERTTISEAMEKKKITVIDQKFLGATYVYGAGFAESFPRSAQTLFCDFIRNISGLTAINDPYDIYEEIEVKYGQDYIQKRGITIESIVESGKRVKSKLYALLNYTNWKIKISNYDDLAQGLEVTYKPLSEKDLDAEELACFKAIRRVNAKFKEYNVGDRVLKLGSSDHALAWTDSYSTIWITKPMLHMMRENKFSNIILILLHEYCHREGNVDSHATHNHNFDFFDSFHTLSMKLPLDLFSDLLRNQYVRWLSESQTRPSAKISYCLDRVFEYYPDLVRKNTDEMRAKFGRMSRKFADLANKAEE